MIVTGPQPGFRDRQHPPFSIAGKQLGYYDKWDLFPQALRLAEQVSPRAVLLKTVVLSWHRFAGVTPCAACSNVIDYSEVAP